MSQTRKKFSNSWLQLKLSEITILVSQEIMEIGVVGQVVNLQPSRYLPAV
jgi:hypothetical protein